MSRIGNKPVAIPSGVTVKVENGTVVVSGAKGALSHEIPEPITVAIEENQVIVTRANDEKQSKAFHGTVRSLIANMIEGVEKGFTKELEIEGVGYRAVLQGRKLVLSLGFSHAIEYDLPEGVDVEVPDQTKVKISGANKQLVGMVAARIRDYSPAEPYKGKGVKYKGEHIRRKAGKTVA
jgi:large subunit ribosomal protein L6